MNSAYIKIHSNGERSQSFTSSEELSLYFHIPFCSKKCPYCHFFVLPNQDHLKETFIAALALDWASHLHQIAGKRIVSIYFGGGTPTLLGVSAIGKIIEWVRQSTCEITADCEITIEANPEDLTLELAQGYKKVGINRLSMGVQSLDDPLLEKLGRTHNAAGAIQAIHNGAAAGFENISIDLMYDLPLQSLAVWKETLSQVKNLPITHLSLYNLTIEPETLFFKKRAQLLTQLPSPEESLQMLEYATSYLELAGLKRYEISAFAKEGCQARHNSGYWTGRPFLGYGPSAFSYFEGKRFRKTPHLNRYKEALEEGRMAIDFEERLEFPSNLHELLAVNLRLLGGVDIEAFQAKYAPLPQATLQVMAQLQSKGWLATTNAYTHLTPTGMLFYDSVAESLI
jgi:oxygen-independent coproporphyrinogen-3 oxidase